MFEVVKNLIILILLSVIIWWIAYLKIYPEKVKDNIEKLKSYDWIVSLISLVVLYWVSEIMKMTFSFNWQLVHNFVVCFFVSVFTELPFFFWYKFKYKIDYEKVLNSIWFDGWKWFLIYLVFMFVGWAIVWILVRIFG